MYINLRSVSSSLLTSIINYLEENKHKHNKHTLRNHITGVYVYDKSLALKMKSKYEKKS